MAEIFSSDLFYFAVLTTVDEGLSDCCGLFPLRTAIYCELSTGIMGFLVQISIKL